MAESGVHELPPYLVRVKSIDKLIADKTGMKIFGPDSLSHEEDASGDDDGSALDENGGSDSEGERSGDEDMTLEAISSDGGHRKLKAHSSSDHYKPLVQRQNIPPAPPRRQLESSVGAGLKSIAKAIRRDNEIRELQQRVTNIEDTIHSLDNKTSKVLDLLEKRLLHHDDM